MLGRYDRFEAANVICITLADEPFGNQHLPRPRGPQCNAARSYFRLLALSESGYIARAMSRAAKAVSLTKAEARRIWLRAQRLDMPAPFGEGPAATAAAVEHLGYVQIDTINVIERSHHHILWTRIPNYRRADLRQAQSVDKSVFEYWTHALSYVPVKDLRFFIASDEASPARRPQMAELGQPGGFAQGDAAGPARRRADDPRYR